MDPSPKDIVACKVLLQQHSNATLRLLFVIPCAVDQQHKPSDLFYSFSWLTLFLGQIGTHARCKKCVKTCLEKCSKAHENQHGRMGREIFCLPARSDLFHIFSGQTFYLDQKHILSKDALKNFAKISTVDRGIGIESSCLPARKDSLHIFLVNLFLGQTRCNKCVKTNPEKWEKAHKSQYGHI